MDFSQHSSDLVLHAARRICKRQAVVGGIASIRGRWREFFAATVRSASQESSVAALGQTQGWRRSALHWVDALAAVPATEKGWTG